MPTRANWRTAFIVGLFLFGPGLESYLERQAEVQSDEEWRRFYLGLAAIVHKAGTNPDKAVELADRLYNQVWGPQRSRRRLAAR